MMHMWLTFAHFIRQQRALRHAIATIRFVAIPTSAQTLIEVLRGHPEAIAQHHWLAFGWALGFILNVLHHALIAIELPLRAKEHFEDWHDNNERPMLIRLYTLAGVTGAHYAIVCVALQA